MSNEEDEELKEYLELSWRYAMRYLQMGWSIIPMRLSDKKPALKWEKYQEAPPTEEEVNDWYETGVPDGNGGYTKLFGLAVVTGKISGLVVADCDNQDALTYALNEAGLFSLLTVNTTRGQHLYFRHPGDEKVQNKVGGVGRNWPDVHGFDLRGDGGYVVAPPSLKFGEGERVQHQYKFNCPDQELEVFADTLPLWPGVKARAQSSTPISAEEWTFDNINLASTESYGANVWDQMRCRVESLGRKLRDGDGRNTWLVRYGGECVASGMEEGAAREAMNQFQSEFFEQPLDQRESETVLQSVITTDKRNHPEKYQAKEKYDNKNDVRKGRASAIRLITPKNLAELKRLASGRKFFIDPFVPVGAIIQVVGFNGHGKSLWLLNLLWAASKGQSFASGHVDEKLRSLYLDFEGSTNTLSERIEDCVSLHGDMDESLGIWNANAAEDPMCLNDPEGIKQLESLINDVNPQLVVIDTVRQAWAGMEENSPHSWTKVNAIAMACRNAGMSVILVHHRNKPDQNGHGREAGSTAQLKDLDVQIMVTKVVRDLDQAKREAAMPDSITQIEDASGTKTTAWTYLARTLPADFVLKYVFEVSFGKLRQATDNHVTTYVGMAQNITTGQWKTTHSMTPMQKAFALHSHGATIASISGSIGVSQPTVEGWIKQKEGKAQHANG